jgi:hypothetical protein
VSEGCRLAGHGRARLMIVAGLRRTSATMSRSPSYSLQLKRRSQDEPEHDQ